MFKVNKKDPRMMSLTPFCGFVDIEQVNVCWAVVRKFIEAIRKLNSFISEKRKAERNLSFKSYNGHLKIKVKTLGMVLTLMTKEGVPLLLSKKEKYNPLH